MALFKKKQEQSTAGDERDEKKVVGLGLSGVEAETSGVGAVDDDGDGKSDRKKAKHETRSFENIKHLDLLRPREKYVFHSDYYQVDNRFVTIMSFFHTEGAQDNFAPFWGVNRIPTGLDNDIQIVLFEQNVKMTEGWINSHQTASEGMAEMNDREQSKAGTNSSKQQASRKVSDFKELSKELMQGAAYMNVHFRLMVIAPTLEKLDEAVKKISRLYTDRFSTLTAAPYYGDQSKELATLFSRPAAKLGKGFYMTSTEYAGAYSLVTHGVEDPGGEYIGVMKGDVNNAAVLFDTNRYTHHVVMADEGFDDKLDRQRATSLWGSKLSQSCLLENGRCVHLILDGTKMDRVGPAFKKLTYVLDLNRGDINMFEMFGKRQDQLAIFASQMQKLILMAEQAYESTDQDRAIIRGSLEQVATRYYIDQRMWYENAKANLDKLRVVGIPHDQVPKLEMFVAYLDKEYKAMVNQSARDPEKLHALSVLQLTFQNLLSNNGDLFNTITSGAIDGAVSGRRVLYDFSQLLQRGTGVAMAQLVNAIGFATNNMGKGDTLFIHGADKIDDSIKKYMSIQFDKLWDAGGRVVFLYNNIDKMLADNDFCRYDRADYMIFGTMTDLQLKTYQETLGQEIPKDLANLVQQKGEPMNYIRRGFDNIVFTRDLVLGGPLGEQIKRGRW